MASAVQTDGAQRFPVVTAIATGIAAVAAVVQYAIPAMIPALQWTPDSQWWRLLTSLLVRRSQAAAVEPAESIPLGQAHLGRRRIRPQARHLGHGQGQADS